MPEDSVTGRDDYIMAKALYYAIKYLETLPELLQEWSDKQDMVAILHAQFPAITANFVELDQLQLRQMRDKEKPDSYAAASPITYLDKSDAPMLLFQGTRDPLIPNTQAFVMAEALTQAEIPGRVELLLGNGHGWGEPHMSRTLETTYWFFDKQLKRPQK